jgi:hypothetical protein
MSPAAAARFRNSRRDEVEFINRRSLTVRSKLPALLPDMRSSNEIADDAHRKRGLADHDDAQTRLPDCPMRRA